MTDPRVIAALTRFHEAGLVPVVSTNGGVPGADVQIVRVPADQASGAAEHAIVVDVWITAAGQARLDGATHA